VKVAEGDLQFFETVARAAREYWSIRPLPRTDRKMVAIA